MYNIITLIFLQNIINYSYFWGKAFAPVSKNKKGSDQKNILEVMLMFKTVLT
jgi:hypothetical protein